MKLLFAVTIYYVCLLSYLSSLPFQPLRKLWSPDRTSTTPSTVIPSTDSTDNVVKPMKSTTSMRTNIKTKATKPLTKRTIVSSSSSSSSPRLITPTTPTTTITSTTTDVISINSDSNSIVDEVSAKTVTKDIMNYFSQNNNIAVDSKKVCYMMM